MEGRAGGVGPARGAAQPHQGGPQHEGGLRHQAMAEGHVPQSKRGRWSVCFLAVHFADLVYVNFMTKVGGAGHRFGYFYVWIAPTCPCMRVTQSICRPKIPQIFNRNFEV